jgi:hypothetical protein
MCTYLGVELELNKFSCLGLDVVWREDERAVGSTDLDDMCWGHAFRCAASSRHGTC